MKILIIHLSKLRNEEWFQFFREFKRLVLKYNPGTLNIEQLFVVFLALLDEADVALEVVRKSAITEQLVEADAQRDHTFRGLVDIVRANLNHFDPSVCEAARRLNILLDHYGNLAHKPSNEETAGLYNLLQELTGAYATDVEMLNLVAWKNKLEYDNAAYETLWDERNAETAARPHLQMKEIRARVQANYAQMTTRIDASATLNGPEFFEPFINELNAVIKTYNDIAAQRHGRRQANNKGKDEEII